MKKLTLPALVDQIKKGNEDAFNELYARYHKLVRYIAFQLTKNHADTEEIVQEVFVQVYKSIDSLKEPEQIKGWISRITYSKVKMQFRKHKDRGIDDELVDVLNKKEEDRYDFVPMKNMHYTSDKEVLDNCLLNLKENFREVLILYYFSQLSIKEIAELTQTPVGTVKSRLLYAKQYLKDEVEEYEKSTHTKLDFKGKTLEAMLISYAASMVPKTAVPFLTFKKITIPTSTALMALKVAGIVALAGGAGYTLYSNYQNQKAEEALSNASFPAVSTNVETKQFTPILYKGKEIKTAEQAYKTLITWAHCEVEMMEKSEAEIKEIQPLFEALSQFGEGYGRLLHRNHWDEQFKNIIK